MATRTASPASQLRLAAQIYRHYAALRETTAPPAVWPPDSLEEALAAQGQLPGLAHMGQAAAVRHHLAIAAEVESCASADEAAVLVAVQEGLRLDALVVATRTLAQVMAALAEEGLDLGRARVLAGMAALCRRGLATRVPGREAWLCLRLGAGVRRGVTPGAEMLPLG